MAGPWGKEVNRGRRKVTGFEANDTASGICSFSAFLFYLGSQGIG